MKTIQITLPEEHVQLLEQASRERGLSISHLIKNLVEQEFSVNEALDADVKDVLADLHSACGMWADREDIGDSDEYVRQLRKGTANRMNYYLRR